jgi:hypothetical protein
MMRWVRARAHDIAVAREQFVRELVLATTRRDAGCPEPGHAREDGAGVLGQGVEGGEAVCGNRGYKREQIDGG